MNTSFVLFGVVVFLSFPATIVGLVASRRFSLPPAIAPVALLPLAGALAAIAWFDTGSLGFVGYGGAAFMGVAGLRGLFELLKALKNRAPKGPMSLLDEQQRR